MAAAKPESRTNCFSGPRPRCTYKLDPAAKPAGFDMTHADGPDKGKTQKGIYSFEGDSLTICFREAGQRPREFTAKAGSGQAMFVLKREKP